MCDVQIQFKNEEELNKIKDFVAKFNGTISTVDTTSTINNAPTKAKTFAEIIKEYGMTDEQVEFYKKYSMERSRKAYERVAAKEIGNTELIADWIYAGYYDAGYRGAEYCSAGHALRYVHIAKNIKTGKEIKFGIKCVTDFFNLTPAQIKFIKNGFAEANDEIKQSIDRFIEFNGDFDKYEQKYHFQEKLNYILENNPSILSFDTDDLVHLLKLGEVQYIFKLKLFLPLFFERMINIAYIRIQHDTETSQALNKIIKNEEQRELIKYLQNYHSQVYSTLLSLAKAANPTDKQKYFINKLMNTPWREVDEIIDQVNEEKIRVKAGYMTQMFDDIIYQFNKWGITEKQYKFLQKTLIK